MANRQTDLRTASALAKRTVLRAAVGHDLDFLRRLQTVVEQDGPDGRIVRNEFEAGVLRMVIEILGEVER